jgi:Pentapeptide repeats (8 copies)
MTAGGPSPGGWKPGEDKFREAEVASQKRTARAQVNLTRITLLATLAAIFTAGFTAVFSVNQSNFSVKESRNSLTVAEQGIERQAGESRLATAVMAIGGQTPAERVAGVELLWRYVDEQLTAALSTPVNSGDRHDAHGLYLSAVIILSDFIPRTQPRVNAPCTLPRQLDVQYAADELQNLLNLKARFMMLQAGSEPPAVDLSYAELCDQYWFKINFEGLSGANFPGIDLRGSNLQWSRWGDAYLGGAQLQCADLRHADLSRATLIRADLRGANVADASLPRTLLASQRAGMVSVLNGNWNQQLCLAKS